MNFPQMYIDGRGEVPFVILKDKVVSLQALEKLTPATIALLEQLANPESAGQVFRVEHDKGDVRLKRMGVVAHALSKASGRR